MGLAVFTFQFDGYRDAPPTEDVLRDYLREWGPGDGHLDRYVVEGARAKVYVMLNPHAAILPYAHAFLMRRGGRPVRFSGEPREVCLPSFVERRWKDLGAWERFRIRCGLGSARA